MKKLFLLILVLSIVCISASASHSAQYWAKRIAVNNYYDSADSIQQTSDGGYIAAGYASDYLHADVYDEDIWVFKLDSSGNTTWQKTYGGSLWDLSRYIQQTSDGGYIVAGTTFVSGDSYALVLKLDSSGNITWQKAYGGSAHSIQQATDGGYIVAGYTCFFGTGSPDVWVLKLNNNGDASWQKAYGGNSFDLAYSIQQTTDEGYIVAGRTDSFGAGDDDYWILKLDSGGNVSWQKTYGGRFRDYAYSIQQTTDGDYIVAGSNSEDIWVLKLDSSGNVTWQKAYGGCGSNTAYSIQQTSDGGYIVAGLAFFGYQCPPHGADALALKLDSSGNISWQKTYGVGSYQFHSIQQTTDGGYIVAGITDFVDADADYVTLVMKLDNDGDIPYCDIMETSNVEATDTYVEGQDSNAAIYSNSAMIIDTTITPQDLSPCGYLFCSYDDPDDTDADGVSNNEDNCTETPNGPFLGTCKKGNIESTCIIDEACGAGGICSMNQEDADDDLLGDACDNCPYAYNPNQEDVDNDSIGDVCDLCPNDPENDLDEDWICGATDNCPATYNPAQEDTDADGLGDVCDDDIDGDNIPNSADNCPYTYNPNQEDVNNNQIGYACESCVIKWWGDWTGWVVTNETSMTTQACHEAFQALFNHAPDRSGPCYVPGPCEGTSCGETFLPEGCDGWGEYINLLGNITCENEIVCDSGEWSKYSYYLSRPWWPGDEYYYDGSWDVFCGIDTDSDGLPDVVDDCTDTDEDGYGNPGFPNISCDEDNCPEHPNGSLLGICVKECGGVIASYRVGDPPSFITCESNNDCIATGGICEKYQWDINGNGCGDVCECYMDCNNSGAGDGKVTGADLAILKQEYGRFDCSEIDPCYADGNDDGKVTGADLALLKNEYGRFDCPVCP